MVLADDQFAGEVIASPLEFLDWPIARDPVTLHMDDPPAAELRRVDSLP